MTTQALSPNALAFNHAALADAIKVFEEIFKDATLLATGAEPVVDMLFPQIALLFNACVAAATLIEAKWGTKGKTATVPVADTEASRLQALEASITPVFN